MLSQDDADAGGDADTVILARGSTPIDPWIEKMRRITWIETVLPVARPILTPAVRALRVPILPVHQAACDPWADHAISLLLAAMGVLSPFLSQQPRSRWPVQAILHTAGEGVLIWGEGPIAKAIARRAMTYGIEPMIVNSSGKTSGFPRSVARSTIEGRMGASAAILSPCFDPEDGRTVGERELSELAAGAAVVNLASPHALHELAVVQAIRSSQLRSAVLTVPADSPVSAESPLWHLPGVYLIPSLADCSPAYGRMIAERLVRHVRQYLAGEWMPPSASAAG